ncbi:MAG: RNA polymerase sigma factor [Coriobacteriia bacterium]|nr:RNA polymerase sigma factor [Coriobacteriia bacterium]
MERAMQDDREALVALCKEIARGVLFRVMRKLHNKQDAEDATQEILARVCSKIKDLQDPRAFGGWLNTIIINETNRHIEKSSKTATILNIQDYLETAVEENEAFLPDEYVIKEEDRREVMSIVDSLPERQLEAVLLHYYDGLTITEAASVMGVTKQSVARYLVLALDKIKIEIQKKADKTSALRGAAFLPIGPLLAQIFQQEAEILDSSRIEQLAMGGAALGGAALAGLAVVKSSLSSILLGPVTSVAATVLTVTALTVGLWTGGVIAPEVAPYEAPASVSEATASIVFSGGAAGYEHLNPQQAFVSSDSEYGELDVIAWDITTLDQTSVLFSGTGSNADDALTRLRIEGKDGEYLLVFTLLDEYGHSYTLTGSFSIRTGA